METAIQIITYGVIVGAVYGLVAVGLALLLGVMKYLNIAHGTFIMLGGYIAFWLFTLWHIDPFVSIPLVMLGMFIVGLILYRVLLSPLLKSPVGLRIGNSMLITFGLLWVLDNAATWLWTSNVRSITTSYTGEVLNIFGVKLPYTGLAGFGLALLVIFALHLLLTKTYFGKSVRATTQDPEAANLMGINIGRTYLISCGIAIMLAGVAGAVIVSSYSITPAGGLNWLLIAMIVVVLAGEENINGVFAAGLVLGLVEAVSVFVTGASYREVIGLVMFVLVLMFRPQGLFTRRVRGT
ncbi:MAG: branched-chain amino acid ABC transporter permease [Dehalococcoidia bacterium]|nr:branched-chain amino acid ABC transporter permease [Dehalococcoidia bacterium]